MSRFGIALKASLLLLVYALAGPVWAQEPVKLGFTMSLTGPFASVGKSAIVAMKLWEEDTNAKGGLLGRPVKLVYYDDQSTPANSPQLYSKLLDVDKVDLVVGPYGTNMTAPALPVIIQHNMVVISLTALNLNAQFHYPRYFAMLQLGSHPTVEFSRGIFDVAMAQQPKPQTIAIIAADSEFSRNNADGARENARQAGLKIVYDRTYPPNTTDYTSVVRAVQASAPDIFYVASYPPDSVGIVRAVNEIGFHPKIFGGSMVGLQTAAIKTQLGPLLNGVITFENWLPVQTMMFPGMADLLKRYQARAQAEGVDPLGYFMPPPSYAYLQVLGEAVNGAKTLDQAKLADYLHSHTFQTVWGDIKFDANGEWAEPRMIQVQFRNIRSNSIDEFKDPKNEAIIAPPTYATGKLIYPYADAVAGKP